MAALKHGVYVAGQAAGRHSSRQQRTAHESAPYFGVAALVRDYDRPLLCEWIEHYISEGAEVIYLVRAPRCYKAMP